jgi:hypothetical protein
LLLADALALLRRDYCTARARNSPRGVSPEWGDGPRWGREHNSTGARA